MKTISNTLEAEGGTLTHTGGILRVELHGSWYAMGRQYGQLLSPQLRHVLAFLQEKGNTPEKETAIRDTAEQLFSRYPEELRAFFRGAAETSGLNEAELRLVNAVEYAEPAFMCSAMAAWGDYAEGELVYGRNYDAMSYLSLKDDLLVTVYHPDGMLSAMTIGYAGEIYCVNGFNEKGLFLEVNNAMPSAGFDIRYDINASTTELLMLLFRAETMEDVDRFFRETQSFSSLTIGVADSHEARSYEWCTAGMQRGDGSTPNGLMLQTNHYMHPAWPYPLPDDEKNWFTLTRLHNLETLAEQHKGHLNAETVKRIMGTPIADGGPMFVPYTLYQLVVLPASRTLWLRVTPNPDWVAIPW